MLKASRNSRVGLLGDFTYQVTTTDSGGDEIATRWVNRLKDISVDLPDELPSEVQVFLLLLLVRKWSDTNN